MASTLLLLDTRFGEDETPYNNKFTINFPTLNTVGYYAVTLQTVEFPNTVYPINDLYNTIYISEDDGATSHAVVLPSRNYSGSSIAATLETLINVNVGLIPELSGVYTVTYDINTKKLTFTCDVNFQFNMGTNHVYDEIGIDTFDVDATTIISDYPVNISGTQYVDLISNLSTNNHKVGNSQHPLARIPVQQEFGTIVFYQPRYSDPQFVSAPMLDEIFIELRDMKGNFFMLPNNSHVSLTISVQQVLSDKIPQVQHFDSIPGATGIGHVYRQQQGQQQQQQQTTVLNEIPTDDGNIEDPLLWGVLTGNPLPPTNTF
ncbi:MAG: hypothetical protein ACXAC2_11165 [Candidatus Kariarchaeaceae archaeon]|jgi:hypothetical protein